MSSKCRLSALIWGYLHPNQVNSVGITTIFMHIPPFIFRGSQITRQTNIYKLAFLLLGCKSFAVNACLHTEPIDTSRCWVYSLVISFTVAVVSTWLFLGCFPFSFASSKLNTCSITLRSGDWLDHCRTFHFFPLRKSWVCFAVCFILLSICTVKRCPMSFEAFGLSLSR